MPYLIFVGDMLVMLFMIILVVWVFVKSSDETINDTAKIPLEDEQDNG
tara:strand:- start:1274 stop:1417 length:144 start_codon:yes stop_codon:yes gene_type:complete